MTDSLRAPSVPNTAPRIEASWKLAIVGADAVIVDNALYSLLSFYIPRHYCIFPSALPSPASVCYASGCAAVPCTLLQCSASLFPNFSPPEPRRQVSSADQ